MILEAIPDNAILKDPEVKGRSRAFLVPESENDTHFAAHLYLVTGWDNNSKPDVWEVAAYISLDHAGCTHLFVANERGAAVHFCGDAGFARFLETLAWAREVARLRIPMYDAVTAGGEGWP